MEAQKVLQGLRNEINETLIWFVTSDLEIYGHIKKETVECFETQKVKFPKQLEAFVEPQAKFILGEVVKIEKHHFPQGFKPSKGHLYNVTRVGYQKKDFLTTEGFYYGVEENPNQSFHEASITKLEN